MRSIVMNKKGFSLVELMVVVAIIGILAAIAVPNFQRFTAKSKQSEAKADLSALYSAERAFAAEWNQFYEDFKSIGYQPTGDVRYLHGFSGPGAVNAPASYNAAAGAGVPLANAPAAMYNTGQGTVCQQGGNALVTGGALQCRQILLPIAPGALGAYTVLSPTSFLAGARADIDGDATIDEWSINESKTLTIVRDDVNN